MDTGRNSEFYPSIFLLEFRFFACNVPMICIRHNQLVSSAGVGRFIVFKSLHKKMRWIGTRKTIFNFHGIYFTLMLAKTTPVRINKRKFSFPFCCLPVTTASAIQTDPLGSQQSARRGRALPFYRIAPCLSNMLVGSTRAFNSFAKRIDIMLHSAHVSSLKITGTPLTNKSD